MWASHCSIVASLYRDDGMKSGPRVMPYYVGKGLLPGLPIIQLHYISPTSSTEAEEALPSNQCPRGDLQLYILDILRFLQPQRSQGARRGLDRGNSLFVRFNKTVLGFPASLVPCHRCQARVTGPHLFPSCAAAEEFITWTAAT